MRFAIEGKGPNWCLTQYTDLREEYWVVGYFAVAYHQDPEELRVLSKDGDQSFALPKWLILA